MTVRTRPLALTAAVAAALLLSGCGSSPLEGKTGPQVADAAADALEQAGAFHVSGTVTSDGQSGDVDLQVQEEGMSGTLSLGGFDLQILGVDGAVYLQGPSEFWAAFGIPESAQGALDGRWVTVPDEAASGFQEFSLAGFTEEIRNPSDGQIKDAVTSDERDGHDVVVAEQENGSTLTVLDDDPSYPLELTNTGDATGTVTFSRFGEKDDIAAPADALDLAELAGGA
jgi:hypothetical protein